VDVILAYRPRPSISPSHGFSNVQGVLMDGSATDAQITQLIPDLSTFARFRTAWSQAGASSGY